MRKRLFVIPAAALVLILLLSFFFSGRGDYTPKLLHEDEVILSHDHPVVEFCFENKQDAAVDIVVELLIDGPYELCRARVLPGEKLTQLSRADGKPFDVFLPGLYGGHILVFHAESGELIERIAPLQVRLYESYRDGYDELPQQPAPSALPLDEEEHRPEYLIISAELERLELYTGLYGLKSEDRALDSFVYVSIDGEDVLLAKVEGLGHRCMQFMLYLEKEAASLLEAGGFYPDARVDSYYSDSGQFYDSIPAELHVSPAS